MSKTFYTDYVRHALRFYSRNSITTPSFKCKADEQNWWSCYYVMNSYPVKTRQVMLSVYSGFDTLADEVYNASKKWNVEQNLVWDMMKETERKVAWRRGLL